MIPSIVNVIGSSSTSVNPLRNISTVLWDGDTSMFVITVELLDATTPLSKEDIELFVFGITPEHSGAVFGLAKNKIHTAPLFGPPSSSSLAPTAKSVTPLPSRSPIFATPDPKESPGSTVPPKFP